MLPPQKCQVVSRKSFTQAQPDPVSKDSWYGQAWKIQTPKWRYGQHKRTLKTTQTAFMLTSFSSYPRFAHLISQIPDVLSLAQHQDGGPTTMCRVRKRTRHIMWRRRTQLRYAKYLRTKIHDEIKITQNYSKQWSPLTHSSCMLERNAPQSAATAFAAADRSRAMGLNWTKARSCHLTYLTDARLLQRATVSTKEPIWMRLRHGLSQSAFCPSRTQRNRNARRGKKNGTICSAAAAH